MELLLDVKQKLMRVWADGLTEACERATQKLLGVERNRIATLKTLPIHAKKPAVKNLFWQDTRTLNSNCIKALFK